MQLPEWERHVQALGPIVVAVIAALIAAYIALRQWWTAHDRLRLDMYERRFAIYDATKTLVNVVTLHGQTTRDDLANFYAGIRGAEFLFDEETRGFLETIGQMGFKARMKRTSLERSPNHPRADNLIDEEETVIRFLSDYGGGRLEKLFSRYLDLSKVGLVRGRPW
jgi:hypothetical protein